MSNDAKCAKKVLGNKSISTATPEELRKIEKCSIIASGGTPNPKVFKKKGYKQVNSPVSKTRNTGTRDISKKL